MRRLFFWYKPAMDYELAKQLKEAGYPIKKQLITRYNRDIAAPTLEELIEACGDRFGALIRHGNWEARSDWSEQDRGISATGSTAIEAVARLWLALHSK
jgi:hypothetical protein